MPYNFVADSFHTKKLCSRLSSSEVRFYRKNGRFAFLSPHLGNLEATYNNHPRLIVKRVTDFLFYSVNWTFSLGITAKALWAIIGSKSAILLQRGPVDPKFEVEGLTRPPPYHTSSQKTKLNDLSYVIKISTDLSSVLSQFTRLTDGQTDGQTDRSLIARPRLHAA